MWCLLERDLDAREYLQEAPMVAYLRPKNLREWLVRAVVPAPPRRMLRVRSHGFRPCGRRSNCTLCLHSEPGRVSSYTCPVTGDVTKIEQDITCTDVGVYMVVCQKCSGQCLAYRPTYVGECGDGESNFTHRLSSHLGSATNPSQVDTEKSLGRHFRLPGHVPDRDMRMIPIEKVPDHFMRKVRETFHIRRLATLKRLPVTDIEHGLNLSAGQ